MHHVDFGLGLAKNMSQLSDQVWYGMCCALQYALQAESEAPWLQKPVGQKAGGEHPVASSMVTCELEGKSGPSLAVLVA